MSYLPSKVPDDDYEDDRSSTETGLLQKKNDEDFSSVIPKNKKSWVVPFLVHGSLILINILFLIFTLQHLRADKRYRRPDIIDSSATSYIEYGTQVFEEIDDFEFYFGKPTPALDAKWHELLKYQWLQLPESDLKRLGRLEEGIRLPDGGYFGTLAVFHDLHCLRRVHKALHRGHYFPGITPEQRALDSRHAGDVSLLTMRWGVHLREPLANFTSPHECVNWDRIQDYAREHVYDVMKPGVLVHPVLGPSYPDGEPGLGVAQGS